MTAVAPRGTVTRGREHSSRPRRGSRTLSRVLPLVPAIVLLLAFMAGPIIYALYGSLTDRALTGPRAANPQFIGLDNYAALFSSPDFWMSLWLTVVFVLASAVIGQNLLGMLLAVLLRSAVKPLRSLVGGLVVLAWVLPEIVAAFALYAFFSKDGTLNVMLGWIGLEGTAWLYYLPMLSVILANIWRGTAFSMMVYNAALAEVPPDLTEAAEIDGANAWQRFIRVTLPFILRSISTNLLLTTLQTLGVFTLIWVMTGGGPGIYPAERLRRAWETVLLQQFHDILPGSSIAWVYHDAERNYAAVARELEDIIATSLAALAGEGTTTLTVNAAPHARGGVPALGGGSAKTDAPALAAPVQDGDGWTLDNGILRVHVDGRGLVTSAVEVATGREAVAPGGVAGLLQLHRDTPTQWDAWDIDVHYRENVADLVDASSVRVEDDTIVVERTFGSSHLTERISLGADARVVAFDLDIDWHETQKLLKFAFPIDVHTDIATSEIQFGHIERPTHTNTSWDAARFETVAHRWVRVDEPGFGVAVVNDSTYGHDITRAARADGRGTVSTVRLSLIRSALFPDPTQDEGRHRLRVGFVVGADVGTAVAEGYRINLPERTVVGGAEELAPLLRVDSEGIVVEAVKLAEDGSGDVVVRLYEALGARTAGRLTLDFEASGVVETDLLERETERRAVSGVDDALSYLDLALRPFEIVTLRIAR